jgi:hypothetical protein
MSPKILSFQVRALLTCCNLTEKRLDSKTSDHTLTVARQNWYIRKKTLLTTKGDHSKLFLSNTYKCVRGKCVLCERLMYRIRTTTSLEAHKRRWSTVIRANDVLINIRVFYWHDNAASLQGNLVRSSKNLVWKQATGSLSCGNSCVPYLKGSSWCWLDRRNLCN